MNDNYLARLREQSADIVGQMSGIVRTAETESRDLTRTETRRLHQLESVLAERKEEIHQLEGLAARMEAPGSFASTVEPYLREARESTGSFGYTTAVAGDPSGALYRSILTTTSSSALATRQDWTDVWPALADSSVAFRSGVRVIDATDTTIHMASGTALAAGGWLAAGGTATASDAGYKGTDVTPARLGLLSEFSRELFEDRDRFQAEAANQMFRSLAIKLDHAVFEGTGASNEPQGMLNLAGSGTATSVAAVTDLSRFAKAMENSYVSGSEVKAWAMSGPVWGELAALTIGIGGTADRRPLLSENVNAGGAAIASGILGRPAYVTGGSAIINVTGGTASTAYGYDPQQVVVVRRRDFQLSVDPFSKLEQGIIRVYLEGRFGLFFPNPAAIQVIPINNLT